MVEKMCTLYRETIKGTKYKSFPTIESLAANVKDTEAKLRKAGFGYRAGYIAKTAAMLADRGGAESLTRLRDVGREEARLELMSLSGVGPKVADCVLLMSLDKMDSIPVDTHMFQIAAADFLPHLRGKKSVSEKSYAEVSSHFRQLYGPYAGWAHSVR